MLETLPRGIGSLLSAFRPGPGGLVSAASVARTIGSLTVSSPAFEDGGPIPKAYTDDGEGLSPPLAWTGVPPTAEAILVIIEDADSPTLRPLVHAILLDRDVRSGRLEEGALSRSGLELGLNSYFKHGYLPPDPPPGHGPHRYAFQVFALDRAPPPGTIGGRSAVLRALKDHVVASGCLIGIYERD